MNITVEMVFRTFSGIASRSLLSGL